MKTHKATAKRLRYTGSGKLMRTIVGKSHLRRNKSKRVKAGFVEMIQASSTQERRVRQLAPYLKKAGR